jgi:hypothetical protein
VSALAKSHGLNVTIPHKQNVIELMDELTPNSKSHRRSQYHLYAREQTHRRQYRRARLPCRFEAVFEFIIHHSAFCIGLGCRWFMLEQWFMLYLTMVGTSLIAARRIEQAQQLANSFTELPRYKFLIFHHSLFIIHHCSSTPHLWE